MTDRPQPLAVLEGIRTPDLRAEIQGRAGSMPTVPDEPPPFPPTRRPIATAIAVTAALVVLGLAALALWDSVGRGSPVASPEPSVSSGPTATATPPTSETSCADLLPECKARRLPDLVLRNGETLGALGPVDGHDLNGILSSDDALRTGGAEAVGMKGKVVRVVLGSADADRLHWGHGTNLYYAIEWGGVCYHGSRPMGSSPRPGCDVTTWSTVIDALTGDFIVEGNGPDPRESPAVGGFPADDRCASPNIVSTDEEEDLVGTDGNDVVIVGTGDTYQPVGGTDVVCNEEGVVQAIAVPPHTAHTGSTPGVIQT